MGLDRDLALQVRFVLMEERSTILILIASQMKALQLKRAEGNC